MTDARGDALGGARKARTHEADEVRFNLKIDIVGVEIVARIAGQGRLDPATQQPACSHVGVPESVLGVLEGFAELLGCGLEPHCIEHLGEGHLDIEVVLIERTRKFLRLPIPGFFIDFAKKSELRGCTICYADHLAGPGATHSALKRSHGERAMCCGFPPLDRLLGIAVRTGDEQERENEKPETGRGLHNERTSIGHAQTPLHQPWFRS